MAMLTAATLVLFATNKLRDIALQMLSAAKALLMREVRGHVQGPGAPRRQAEFAPRPVVRTGEIRASTHAQVWSIEDGIEDLIAARTVDAIVGAHGRTLNDCLIERYDRDGPRRIVGTRVVQTARIHFLQLVPIS